MQTHREHPIIESITNESTKHVAPSVEPTVTATKPAKEEANLVQEARIASPAHVAAHEEKKDEIKHEKKSKESESKVEGDIEDVCDMTGWFCFLV